MLSGSPGNPGRPWNSTALSRRPFWGPGSALWICPLKGHAGSWWGGADSAVFMDPSSPGVCRGVYSSPRSCRGHQPKDRTPGPRLGGVSDSGLSQSRCLPLAKPRHLCCGLETITWFLGAGKHSVLSQGMKWWTQQQVMWLSKRLLLWISGAAGLSPAHPHPPQPTPPARIAGMAHEQEGAGQNIHPSGTGHGPLPSSPN